MKRMTNVHSRKSNKNKGAVVLLHNFLRLCLIQALSKLAELMMSVRLVTKDPLIFVAIKAVDPTVSLWVQQTVSSTVGRRFKISNSDILWQVFWVCLLSEADLLYFKRNLSVKEWDWNSFTVSDLWMHARYLQAWWNLINLLEYTVDNTRKLSAL